MSFFEFGGPAVGYAPALDNELQTVMVNAEFDPELTQPDKLAVSPAKELVESWMQAGQVPVLFPEEMPTEGLKRGLSLVRIAQQHHRSLDVPKVELLDGAGDISIKGGTLVEPGLKTDWDSHLLPYRDFRFGMYYRDAEAAHKGSTLMQERGIDFGEQILAVAKLVEMPTKDGVRPAHDAMSSYRRIQPYLLPYNRRNPALQPVIAIRQMPNSYRLWDLYKGGLGSDLAQQILTRSMRVAAAQTPVFMEGLNPYRPMDMLRYLYQRVPVMAGYSLGRLKEAGLKQQYPHEGNISLSLSLPDADGIVPVSVNIRQPFAKQLCVRSIVSALYRVRTDMPQSAIDSNLKYLKSGEVTLLAGASYARGFKAGAAGKHPNEL